MGDVSTNVAWGNWSVSSASRARPSRRLSLVVRADMSAVMVAACTVVPSISSVPVTSGVRPTAVVDPTPLSSSATRKPAKVPVESSKENSPIEVSTFQVPATSPSAASAPVAAAVPPAEAVPPVVVLLTWAAASVMLVASGASSRRNHQANAATAATAKTPMMATSLSRPDRALVAVMSHPFSASRSGQDDPAGRNPGKGSRCTTNRGGAQRTEIPGDSNLGAPRTARGAQRTEIGRVGVSGRASACRRGAAPARRPRRWRPPAPPGRGRRANP